MDAQYCNIISTALCLGLYIIMKKIYTLATGAMMIRFNSDGGLEIWACLAETGRGHLVVTESTMKIKCEAVGRTAITWSKLGYTAGQ